MFSVDYLAPIYQLCQASHNPQRLDNWGHGDESQEAAGAAERAGGGGRQLCMYHMLRCNSSKCYRQLYVKVSWCCVLQEEETEVDSHTMVKSGSEGAGTMRATSTMSDGAQTMIEHGSTMLESDLGTMVINSDDEEEEEDQGSMRSEHT